MKQASGRVRGRLPTGCTPVSLPLQVRQPDARWTLRDCPADGQSCERTSRVSMATEERAEGRVPSREWARVDLARRPALRARRRRAEQYHRPHAYQAISGESESRHLAGLMRIDRATCRIPILSIRRPTGVNRQLNRQ
jgi:hypothetical protein